MAKINKLGWQLAGATHSTILDGACPSCPILILRISMALCCSHLSLHNCNKLYIVNRIKSFTSWSSMEIPCFMSWMQRTRLQPWPMK